MLVGGGAGFGPVCLLLLALACIAGSLHSTQASCRVLDNGSRAPVDSTTREALQSSSKKVCSTSQNATAGLSPAVSSTPEVPLDMDPTHRRNVLGLEEAAQKSCGALPPLNKIDPWSGMVRR